MTSWQRRTRFALAVFAIGIVGVVVYTKRAREVRAPVAPVERLDPKATVETRGGDAIQLKGTRQNLRIEFESQVTYKDGQTKLLGVKAKVDNRGGRNYVISAKEARIGTDQSTFDVTGSVRLETSDGLVATSERASYTDAEGIVRAPGPVQFSRGRMSGTGVGFTFDEQRDTLWLLDQAIVHFQAEGDAGPMDVTAGTAGFAKKDRYMRFERTVHLVREGQVVDADESTVHLQPERDEPTSIELRGNSRVTGGTGLGSLRQMSARDITLSYAEDGRTLQQAVLAGKAGIHLAGKDGSSRGQQLSAEFLDISLAADGAVTSLSSREGVEVVLPAAKDIPSRTIRSTSLTATGAAGQGLTAMKFQEGTEFQEAATPDHAARSARARTLDAELNPGTDSLRQAKFTEGFRFEEGPMRASSADALYQIDDGQLALSGRDNGNPPHVADERVTIDAERIDITLSPRKMVATGAVRTVLQATTREPGDASAARRPGLLKDQDPVNVMSDKLSYEEDTRRGVYTGKARLWQGDTVIQSDTITLDEAKGDLSANGKVLTTLMIGRAQATAESASPPTIARAGSFVYADRDRRAHYEVGAHMNGEQGDLHADNLTLFLAKDENNLDRLEALGKVSVTVDKRVATGIQLTYQPDEEKYIITGAPVKLVEECRESTGKTLTFFKSSDRVIVDGNEENRTQTKGGKCPGTPN